MRLLPRMAVVVLCVASVLAATGCSPRGVSRSESPVPASRDSASIPSPGLVRTSDQDAEAVGTLVYRRDQGGFFAVSDIVPDAEPSRNPRLLAILVNEDGTRRREDLAPLVGRYCRFIGSIVETEATTFTAPLLRFDTYHMLDSTPASAAPNP